MQCARMINKIIREDLISWSVKVPIRKALAAHEAVNVETRVRPVPSMASRKALKCEKERNRRTVSPFYYNADGELRQL